MKIALRTENPKIRNIDHTVIIFFNFLKYYGLLNDIQAKVLTKIDEEKIRSGRLDFRSRPFEGHVTIDVDKIYSKTYQNEIPLFQFSLSLRYEH